MTDQATISIQVTNSPRQTVPKTTFTKDRNQDYLILCIIHLHIYQFGNSFDTTNMFNHPKINQSILELNNPI